MGINYNYSKDDQEETTKIKEETINITGPKFYLNKDFPNYYNISLEDMLKNLLTSKYDLLENPEYTSSLSKKFKLLCEKKSDNNINNNNEFSFSKAEFKGEQKPEKNTDNNMQKNNNNIKLDLKLDLLNNTDNNKLEEEKIIEEKNKENNNNIDKNHLNNNIINDNNNNNYINYQKNRKFYMSDYNIFSSQKQSEKNIQNINQNIKLTKNNLILKKESIERKSSKSSETFANKIQEDKPRVKIRKYTGPESNLIKAASLLKDIRKEYRFKNQLGGGHFGTVRKAYRISEKKNKNKFYAIKSIPMKNLSCNIDDFIKEVDIISTLDHPNIIKFYETYHDDCFFHIVMELCQGKEIVNQMGNYGFIEEKKVAKIIFKVLLAIVHCHNRGVTHRDLKPENILFDTKEKDAEIKLIDFGLSRKYDKEQKMHSILGTPYYVAPEVLKGEYDEKCDIWSIGAMTYLMLCGEPPFNGNSNNEIFRKIVKESIKFNSYMWKNISKNAKDFVKICLNKNSIKRPSASEALKHPWFANVIKKTHDFKKIKKEILLNIKDFNIKFQFQQMVLKYLVDNKLSHEEKQIFTASFYALDFNHNGFILEQDLKKAFDLFRIDIDEEQISLLFNILPENKNLGLGFCEFIMAGIDKKAILTEENLNDAFNYFDINKTGNIEFVNLNSAFLRSGKRYVNSNDVNSIINEVMRHIKKNEIKEINKDNKDDKCLKISKEDFMEIFKEFL